MIQRRQQLAGIGFLVPALLVLVSFLAVPAVYALAISFTRYDLVNAPRFIGLANYTSLFADPQFWASTRVTVLFLVATGVPLMALSLALALALDERLRGARIMKFVIFAPVVVSEVVAAVVWRFILHPYGILNELLFRIGIDADISWLTSPATVLWAFVILTVWKQLGYFMVIFATGLATIPPEYHEAAQIDGAGAWRRFRHVTLPLLRPTMLFAITMMFVILLNSFAPFYLMTNGGPAGASEVISLFMYNLGFVFLDFGRASAVAILMMAVIGLVSVLQFTLFREQAT